MKRLFGILPWGIVFAWLATEAAAPTLEYQVKASYLYHLTQFVEWPADALGDQAPLVIGIFGEDRFGSALDTLARQTSGTHPIAVKRFNKIEDIDTCHVLFVGAAEGNQRDRLLAGLADRPILTVGEAPGWAKAGFIVNFIRVNNHIRFEIHNGAAVKAKLKLSSKLLNLAVTVYGHDQP